MTVESSKKRDALRVMSSHMITTCATLTAIILFAVLGSQVIPNALGATGGRPASGLTVAFLLNIAIILFGWQRAKALAEAVAALRAAEREAHQNAYFDCVTTLPNRRALVKQLDATLGGSEAQGVLVLFDLDHFKKVNDLHGHSAGDCLLTHVGRLLNQALPNAGMVARLGGDEFAVILPRVQAQDAEIEVRRALEKLGTPMAIDGLNAQVSASAGVALLCAGLSSEDMLRRADIAMYSAKRAGRNTLAWFDSDQEVLLRARAALEEEIRKGIDADEFVPFFQPLINLSSGEPTGYEVLARWNSRRRGLLEPDVFIEIAEASGLIAALSMNVMKQALEEARDWPAHLKLAVNLSPVQFRDPRLAERVLKLLAETGFPARRLELEITEGSLIENPTQATTIVHSLKNNGITIALDDFGTGYASLTQLQSLPFDRIKIDKSFVASIGDNEQSAAIVQTITSLGKLLCVPITAEGVETETIRRLLAEVGCEDAQGWLFGRAVSANFIRSQFALPGEASVPGAADVVDIHERRDTTRRASIGPSRAASGRKW